jgi:uncharacterized membrane-anchored protein YitT (DUF2179 family)
VNPQRSTVARDVVDYVTIAVGAVLIALSADMFAIPNQVVPGGITGIAAILHYTVHVPVGLTTLLFNIPLLLAGYKWSGGRRFAARTIFATSVMAMAIDLLANRVHSVTTDPLLYTIYGGLLDGLGMGLVFRARGTTGGTDIMAQLLNRWTGMSLGAWLLILNAAILCAAGLVLSWERALYALILSYASSRAIDLVQEGISYHKSALIISGHADQVKEAILQELARGVTVLRGQGGYTGIARDVLLSVVRQSEISQLKKLVYDIDPVAFVIIGQAQEVLGEGFKRPDSR